jgi:chromosome segregation protein
MRLKSLELVGFKSFAQKTLLQFNPGITAIVGPNGCGKSNIVDALRWLMGEQSARHLRGHSMEDVVFSGSESLAPTGMAEVSLILDNSDGRGPAEYLSCSEIMVTRRLFRSGESEYEINKVSCRLKDIIELFLGTGAGSKAYSIVEQGRVEEMVNAKPEERRALIEEAAGTSKYKSRKVVAERKLERTQQNLLRVSDIVREIERQIRSLELQAKKAERYRALKQEMKEKDLSWASWQRRDLEEEIAGCEARLGSVEDRAAQLFAALHAREADSEATRVSLLDAERAISDKQETLYQRKVRIQGEEQRVDFYRKDRLRLEEAERQTQSELVQLQGKLASLSEEIDQLKQAQDRFIQLSLFEEGLLRDKESALERIKGNIRDLREALEREKDALIDMINDVAQGKNDLGAKERERAELDRELAKTQASSAESARSLTEWREKNQQKEAALDLSAARAREVADEAEATAAAVDGLARQKEEQESKVESLKERLQETRSQLGTLEELQRNYEGYQEGVRAIMLKRQGQAGSDGIYGLVAEVIEAPEHLEKALTAVLGDRLQGVIVRSHEEGFEAIEYLKRESSGRSSFIPRHLSPKVPRSLPVTAPEVIVPLLDSVSVKDDYHDIADYLLADVVVVRDLRSGLELWNRNGFINTLVTPEGEVIDPMGVVTGGSSESLEGSLLSQKRRIRELAALLPEIEADLTREEATLGAIKAELQRAEERRRALVEESHRLELERIRLEHDRTQTNLEVERLEAILTSLAAAERDLATSLEASGADLEGARRAIETRLQQKIARESGVVEKQQALSRLEGEAERLEAEVTESRVRGAALGERKENGQINLDNRLRLLQELRAQAESRERSVADIEAKKAQLEQAIGRTENWLQEEHAAVRDLEETLQAERHDYREISRRLTDTEETIKELRPQCETAQEERGRLQVHLSEKRLGLQHLVDTIRDRYNVGLQEIEFDGPAEPTSREELITEIEELRLRLERMGEVNLAAIGEFQDLNSRYQFLTRQKEDLERSIADLQRTIIKLNRICRFRFKEAFEEINEKFQQIYPQLFRGGKASLVLTDENDYLETGVEIVAQPPGKKLQSITLLSGGEKALTAVSLLFAIFLTKPSPFCFLDEVDAPLDDANIDRFNEMVRELSRTSQFVLVTHNKRTMQSSEVLYGITMEEPGVSKVVSVRMH